jgi:hypothetical protein
MLVILIIFIYLIIFVYYVYALQLFMHYCITVLATSYAPHIHNVEVPDNWHYHTTHLSLHTKLYSNFKLRS